MLHNYHNTLRPDEKVFLIQKLLFVSFLRVDNRDSVNRSFIFSATCFHSHIPDFTIFTGKNFHNFTYCPISSDNIWLFHSNNIIDTHVSFVCISLSTRDQRWEDVSLPVFPEIIHYSLYKLNAFSWVSSLSKWSLGYVRGCTSKQNVIRTKVLYVLSLGSVLTRPIGR